jgi:sugar phosphate isomerase/epimerase
VNGSVQDEAELDRTFNPFRGVGCWVEDRGDPAALDAQLRVLVEGGWTHAELDPSYWDVWLGGGVNSRALSRWLRVIDRYRDRIRYTLHGPMAVNLFDVGERDLHLRLLRSGFEVARAVGAEVVVYHPGRRLDPPVQASISMTDLMALERETIAALAEELEGWKGTVAVENLPCYCDNDYTYGVWPDQLARQVEAIGHPDVGVCLDFGHLFLMARWFGFDALEGVRALAPLTVHLHLQDVFGISARPAVEALGWGDLHLPPGWGAIPYDEIFGTIAFPRRPVLLVEVSGQRFLPYLGEIMDECRRLAALARRPEPAEVPLEGSV